MYDSTIKYTDKCVGELFDFTQKHSDNTVVVITADHGELFGEYGLLGHHIVLHDGLVHIPLVTYGLDDVSHHTDNPTQHIDIMKTLLGLVGADMSQFQGYDLREQNREIAISQDLRGTVDDDEAKSYERIRQYNSDFDYTHLPESLVTAIRSTEYKLVQTDSESKLYQLPDETKDIKHKYSEVYNKFTFLIEEWWETQGKPFEAAPKKTELTEEMEQHLQDMGYI
jgi:uncharacterized sulfatase